MSDVRLSVLVSGEVQGVGFRWWTQGHAQRLGLVGSAVNLPDGRVEVVAEGPRDACDALVGLLHGRTPGRVTQVHTQLSEPTGQFAGFSAG